MHVRLQSVAFLLGSTLALGGCGGSDTGSTDNDTGVDDTAVGDTGARPDTRIGDSTGDTPPDTGSDSAKPDTAPVDTGSGDTAKTDSGPADTGKADTGPADTGKADTGPADTGPADTGVIDSTVIDTGTLDSGVDSGVDTGVLDVSVDTAPPCTPGGACTSTAACHVAAIDCSTGSPVCTDTGNLPDGTSCGTGSVCNAGACVPCADASACTPAAGVCHTGVTSCTTGSPVCTDTGNAADGLSCGTDQVCSGGTCTACVTGAACTPSTNACHTGVTSCSTGTSVCTDTGTNAPIGTTCGTGMVCNDVGACIACSEGSACTPANACHTGTLSCGTGTPVCMDSTTPVPDGTSCGSLEVCTGGTCGCVSGATPCGTAGTCVYLGNDVNNCGACGNVCPAGASCSNTGTPPSTCSCPASAPTVCGSVGAGACTSLLSDANNCGACGNVCTAGNTCRSGSCYRASCKELKDIDGKSVDGVYTIDSDGSGPNPPFNVYCEMSTNGGGWTLILKADGTKPTFAFDSPLWADSVTLNPLSTDLSKSEAKFMSFSTVPFGEIEVRMDNAGDVRTLSTVLATPASSMEVVQKSGHIDTTAGRAAWLGLVAGGVTQPFCNVEGLYDAVPPGPPYARVRIGILGNQENNCGSPDSFLGVGGTEGPSSCYGGLASPVSVGVAAGGACSPTGSPDVATFAYVFVR